MQNQLPVKHTQNESRQGPYVKITCAVRSDYEWMIPFFPGQQSYTCPMCYGKTLVKIYLTDIEISGEETMKTHDVDKLRFLAMRYQQIPQMPQSNEPPNLEDFLNSLR